MQNSPLIQTFRSLTKTERRAFGKWLSSPFFNQRSDVVRLFDYLCEQVPVGAAASAEPAFSKTSAFSQVFPSDQRRKARAYDDAEMRHAMSFLFQELKQFLAYRHWSEDTADTGRHLCRELRRRGLEQVFEKEFAALSVRLDESAHRSTDYYFQQYHLHLERWEVFRRSNRSTSDALQQAGAARDAYIAAETLRQACAVLAQPGERGAGLDSVYLDATLSAVDSGAFQTVPAVIAYYCCYRLLSDSEGAEADFRQLRVLLDTHWAVFPGNEVRDLYVGAINYCIRRLNSGARDYIREALNLYRSGLAHGVILEDGFLNKYTYNNILLLAIALEEWDWALEFLEQYKAVLPPRDRDSAWQFNLAIYYFRKKDYERAQEILRRAEFRDVFYNLDARRMLTRIYFDTEAVAALESLLDSCTTYLQRKRAVLGYHWALNQNFVRFVKRLLQLEPGNTTARERLRAKIAATDYVAEREWLLSVCS